MYRICKPMRVAPKEENIFEGLYIYLIRASMIYWLSK